MLTPEQTAEMLSLQAQLAYSAAKAELHDAASAPAVEKMLRLLSASEGGPGSSNAGACK